MNRHAAFSGLAAIACAAAVTLTACGGSGGGSAVGTSGAHATPTVAAHAGTTALSTAVSIAGIDFRNYTYQDQACGTKKLVRFTNGQWRRDPTSTTDYCGMTFTAVAFADVTGDGIPDAIVTGSGSYGGGTAVSLLAWTTVFAATPTGPVNRGYFDGTAFPRYSAAGGITVWSRHLGPNDPACCPSSYQKTTYTFTNSGTFRQVSTALVPASELPSSSSSTSAPPTSTTVGSGPCTYAVISAALNAGRTPDDQQRLSRDGFHCSGIWAVAFPETSDGDEVTVLLKWDGNTWQHSDNCNASLPAPIYPDCFSN
jgi:hypothetical protein